MEAKPSGRCCGIWVQAIHGDFRPYGLADGSVVLAGAAAHPVATDAACSAPSTLDESVTWLASIGVSYFSSEAPSSRLNPTIRPWALNAPLAISTRK